MIGSAGQRKRGGSDLGSAASNMQRPVSRRSVRDQSGWIYHLLRSRKVEREIYTE